MSLNLLWLLTCSVPFVILSLKKPLFSLYFLFLFVFARGILDIFGISSTVTNTITQLIVFMFCFSVLSKATFENRTINILCLEAFILFTIIVLSSAIINDSPWFKSYSFYRYTLDAYLIFLTVLNLPLSKCQILKINKLIFSLFILQIVASVIKFISVGRMENIIGTLSYSSGTYSTLFPLIAISYLTSLYLLYKKQRTYLLLCLGFLFMAWVGGKRAIFFFLPVVLFIIYIFYKKVKKQLIYTKVLKIILPILICSSIIFYFGVRLSPSLNPEDKMWGSFNLNYLSDYLYEYNFRSYQKNQMYTGRGGGTQIVIKTLLNSSDKLVPLFGYGPSKLIGVSKYEGESLFKFHFIQIIITGLSYFLLSVGILGSLSILLFYYWFGKQIYRFMQCDLNPYFKATAFGLFITTIIIFIDFFFYSRAFVHSIQLNLVYFFLAGVLLKNESFIYTKDVNEVDATRKNRFFVKVW